MIQRALAALLAVAALALLGCSRTNISEYVKALAQDQATFCLTNDLSSPWGNDKVLAVRTNLQNGNVQCTKDGLTVTSATPTQVISTPPNGSFILVPSK